MKRTKHSLSNYKLLTGEMGKLIPCGLTEVLPGDSIQQATSALIRTSPLLAPVMHPVSARIHHWFVPHRIVWDGWEDFITGGPDNANTRVFPTIDMLPESSPIGQLSDYLGLPVDYTGTINALPFRGYSLIYNEWYRDQDLTNKRNISTADGTDILTAKHLASVAWEKDYFTSSRPWAQKGPAIALPLGDKAFVKGIGAATTTYPDTNQTVYESDGTSRAYGNSNATHNSANVTRIEMKPGYTVPNIYADMTSVTGATINQLREAFALQRYAENRARYGSRYTEYLKMLGVNSSDARLQRPEYLGGGKNTLQFSEIVQSGAGAPTEESYVGQLKGHGIGALKSNRYRRFFEEHGYVFTLLSVLPKTIYSQGLSRTWNRRTKEDFYQKELEHIGQQEILNKEIYAKHTTPEGTFGFQDRYDEYRRSESQVHGDFRPEGTLDFWHFAREFAADPVLNDSFVTADPAKRAFAVTESHPLWIMVNNNIQARRIVSKTGNSFIY